MTGSGTGGMDPRRYYDEFSAGYEDRRGRGYHAFVDDLEAGLLGPHLQDARVLEVGCGTGLILRRLLPRAREVFGADLSEGMLRRARARGLPVVQADAVRLPFPDGVFDVVCSFKVLAHIPDVRAGLAEMARVLRPGGWLAAEFYNRRSLRALVRAWRGPERISPATTEAAVFTRYDDPEAMRSYLPDGLDLLRVRGVRVLTPAAFLHDVPLLGPLLRAAERRAADSPLARLGGFLILLCRKR